MPQTSKRHSSSQVKPPAQLAQQSEKTPVNAAALSDEELLSTSVYKLPEDQQEIIRARILSRIMKSLIEMSTGQLQDVAIFIAIHEHEQGCVTPFEQLVVSLVNHYGWRTNTPEAVEGLVESFRTEFAEAIQTAKYIHSRYPSLVNDKSDSSGEAA